MLSYYDRKYEFLEHIYDLENVLIPNADRIYGGRRWLLQQDNGLYYTSNLSSDFIVANDIALLPFPDRSPDLSSIENIWGLIKRKIAQIQINSQMYLVS